MLYFDAAAGISGDMTVAALLDLGADAEKLKKVLAGLPLEGFSVQISRVKKSAIDCCDFAVLLDEELENHDHDMGYLFGEDLAAGTGRHDHGQELTKTEDFHDRHHHEDRYHHEDRHYHEDGHHHVRGQSQEHHHHHVHRTLADVTDILDRTEMPEGARTLAKRIFAILAKAEAEAHGTTVEEVHFHEVGAVDSIVDIVSAAVCLDDLREALGTESVVIPSLYEGRGTVRTAHGLLTIPVPAVANIAAAEGLILQIGSEEGEFVTPTGAAIAAAVKTEDRLPETFTIKKIGLGAGKRVYKRPGILRVMEIETDEQNGFGERKAEQKYHEEPGYQEEILKLETNIDDCSGEVLGYVLERLFEAGARDVHYTPVYMKKNRPGWQLNVVCMKEDAAALEEIIFRETTSIGIREIRCGRSVLPREQGTVGTEYGTIRMKNCFIGEMKKSYPEYESVAAAARASGVSFQEVYAAAAEQGKSDK